jgi:Kef-type K+ transport system membrane component KefB
MSKLYLLFFLLGFLLDKVRLFPFIVGLIAGILIKAVIDNQAGRSLDSLCRSATDVYQRFQTPAEQETTGDDNCSPPVSS